MSVPVLTIEGSDPPFLDHRTSVRYGERPHRPHRSEAPMLRHPSKRPSRRACRCGRWSSWSSTSRPRAAPLGSPDHRDRRRPGPRRGAPRHVPGARRSRRVDPTVHRAPDRHRRLPRPGGATDRGGPARVPRVRPRRGLRGPQRALRLLVPEREPRTARLSPSSRARPSARRSWRGGSCGPTCPTSVCRPSRRTSAPG